MRTKRPLTLIFLILVASLAAAPPARTRQGRNVGVGLAQAGASGYHALVIGNNDYKTLPRLKTAEADAREVAALLKESYGFETTLLLNATRAQVVSALSGYRRRLGPESSLLVYYAGHGSNDKQAEESYWLPVDAATDDDANWISADDITTRIRAIPARHVLVVSDSCYSGTLARDFDTSLPPAKEREQYLRRMAAGRSRRLMASGGDEPVADGGGGGRHSVFANAFLRGLREIGRERFTGGELFRYYVEEPVAGRADQTPEYNALRNSGHEGGDFVFSKLRAESTSAEPGTQTRPSVSAAEAAAFELEFWSTIKYSTDPEEFRDYLKSYPDGRFADIARRRAARPAPAAVARPAAARPEPGTVRRTRAGIELVYVPSGEFSMGSEKPDGDEWPARRVTFREGFWMGRHEVTQAQWQAVMGNNPSKSKGDDLPVEQVSWNNAISFVARLNARNDGFTYRLPTEAEWEYACRAGTTGDYAGNLDAMAWYGANSGDKTHPVGRKDANRFGLYDMHGNVWEWCQDWYHENYKGAPTDGRAWLTGGEKKHRVLRGGSWVNYAGYLRSAYRDRDAPTSRVINIGLRVVAVART